MKSIRNIAAISCIALSVAACQQGGFDGIGGMGGKETVGTVAGAAGGGLLGSQIGSGSGQLMATAAGVFLGGLLGQQVGSSLDKADELEAQQAYSRALESAPTGNSTTWSNPDSGNSGTYTPTRTYQTDNGRYCREFRQTVTIDGETRTLPTPFIVLATQNPVEQAGTYPLPEAQIDRFLVRLLMGYPSQRDEVAVLDVDLDADLPLLVL